MKSKFVGLLPWLLCFSLWMFFYAIATHVFEIKSIPMAMIFGAICFWFIIWIVKESQIYLGLSVR
jgi:hypothetical protein